MADTVSAASSYDVFAVVADNPTVFGSIWFGAGDDNWSCTFPPPVFGCPDFTTVPLPADGTYYLVVTYAAAVFAGSAGAYAVSVDSSLPIGPLTLVTNDVTRAGEDPVAALSAQAASTASSALRSLQAKRSGRPPRER